MEIFLTVLWAIFWPWAILALLGFLLYLTVSDATKTEQELDKKQKELGEAQSEIARLRARESDLVKEKETRISRLESDLRDAYKQHREELEKAKRASLDSLLGLRSDA